MIQFGGVEEFLSHTVCLYFVVGAVYILFAKRCDKNANCRMFVWLLEIDLEESYFCVFNNSLLWAIILELHFIYICFLVSLEIQVLSYVFVVDALYVTNSSIIKRCFYWIVELV